MLLENDCYAVGMMSGTSLDGIDVAIVHISEENEEIQLKLKSFSTIPYSTEVKHELLTLCDPKKASIQMISSMNMLLGKLYGQAAGKVIENAGIKPEEIAFISSHGQTIFHQPEAITIDGHQVTSTLQIGDISTIAEITGITTVGDFRTRDMAVGGQGAPLVPYADYLLLRDKEIGRVLVNIGGISNLTVLPANGDESQVKAYDTGPGNMLIDYFASRLTNGQITSDQDGKFAAKGAVNEAWIKELLTEPYYALEAPKSTGRELFGEDYAEKLWEQAEALGIKKEDRVATITQLTAITLTNEIKRQMKVTPIHEVYISGGGSYNPTLMKNIGAALPDEVWLRKTDELGVHADAKEAMVFALLGYQFLKKRTNNLPAATGADRNVMMGKVAWGTLRR